MGIKLLRRPVRPKVDFWSMWDLDEGRELPCNNSRTLLWAIISGKDKIRCAPQVYSRYCDVVVLGPVCDSAVDVPARVGDAPVPPDHCLRVKYRLRAAEVSEWTGAERSAFEREIGERCSNAAPKLVFKALGLKGAS